MRIDLSSQSSKLRFHQLIHKLCLAASPFDTLFFAIGRFQAASNDQTDFAQEIDLPTEKSVAARAGQDLQAECCRFFPFLNWKFPFPDRFRTDWTRQYDLWGIDRANGGIRNPQRAFYQFFSGMEDPDWIRLGSDRLSERFESKLIIGLTENLPINQPIAQHRNFRVANDRDPDD